MRLKQLNIFLVALVLISCAGCEKEKRIGIFWNENCSIYFNWSQHDGTFTDRYQSFLPNYFRSTGPISSAELDYKRYIAWKYTDVFKQGIACCVYGELNPSKIFDCQNSFDLTPPALVAFKDMLVAVWAVECIVCNYIPWTTLYVATSTNGGVSWVTRIEQVIYTPTKFDWVSAVVHNNELIVSWTPRPDAGETKSISVAIFWLIDTDNWTLEFWSSCTQPQQPRSIVKSAPSLTSNGTTLTLAFAAHRSDYPMDPPAFPVHLYHKVGSGDWSSSPEIIFDDFMIWPNVVYHTLPDSSTELLYLIGVTRDSNGKKLVYRTRQTSSFDNWSAVTKIVDLNVAEYSNATLVTQIYEPPPCVPETNEEFCNRYGVECGTIRDKEDNCGKIRPVYCKCPSSQVCYNNECCTPVTDCGDCLCGKKDNNCGGTIDCGPCGEGISYGDDCTHCKGHYVRLLSCTNCSECLDSNCTNCECYDAPECGTTPVENCYFGGDTDGRGAVQRRCVGEEEVPTLSDFGYGDEVDNNCECI